MDYMNDSFTYTAQHNHNHPVFYQPMTYFTFRPHPSQAVDDFYSSYGQNEYTDFMQYHEDYEELGAVSTRPRLTREQVEVLEAQFQANHKPNSILKRHLAVQTRLSPARVANWFQNRRAKAKQQRKQEEFENAQSHGHTDGPEAEVSIKTDQPEFDDDADSCTIFSQHDSHVVAPEAETSEHPRGMDQQTSKEAGWASVQRAVRAGREALELREMHQRTQMQTSASNDLPQQPHQMPLPTSVTSSQQYGATLSQWQTRQPLMDPWSPTHPFQDTSFNFGFDPQDASSLCKQESRGQVASHEFTLESGVVAQQPWQEAVPATDLLNDPMEAHFLGSPDIPLPQYPESRRGSAADSLTANFGTFALASESPQMLANPMPMMTEPLRRPEGYLNIAARRKGPRPATLTPEALWNRSYGAMTSVSPTARSGMTPSAHTIRHVKSTGHGLNGARPGGIRKASSAQRSPINVSTFAEADSLHRLIAQQATAAAQSHAVAMSNAENATSVSTPGLVSNTQSHPEEGPGFLAQKMHLASRYQLPNTQHLTLNTASPPTTPFSAEFAHSQQHLMMPPASAPLQHAHFLEYTPPYSAGPLTSSSWSDAPQTSPDFPTFPPVTYVPALNQAQKMDSPQSYFQPFVLQSDNRSDLNQMSSILEQKKTEFLIQEFPNQKEEHAHIAQQLVPTRPKNYVFTNTAASDYDQA